MSRPRRLTCLTLVPAEARREDSGTRCGAQWLSRLPRAPRGEAIRLHVGWLWLEVRALRRADPSLPKAHRSASLPLPALFACFFALGSSGLAHEASSLSPAPALGPFLGTGVRTRTDPGTVVFPRMNPRLDSWAHRSTKDWPIDRPGGASSRSSHMSLAKGSHSHTRSCRPSEIDLQINGLRWILRYF